jgi:hypothetical protein
MLNSVGTASWYCVLFFKQERRVIRETLIDTLYIYWSVFEREAIKIALNVGLGVCFSP